MSSDFDYTQEDCQANDSTSSGFHLASSKPEFNFGLEMALIQQTEQFDMETHCLIKLKSQREKVSFLLAIRLKSLLFCTKKIRKD